MERMVPLKLKRGKLLGLILPPGLASHEVSMETTFHVGTARMSQNQLPRKLWRNRWKKRLLWEWDLDGRTQEDWDGLLWMLMYHLLFFFPFFLAYDQDPRSRQDLLYQEPIGKWRESNWKWSTSTGNKGTRWETKETMKKSSGKWRTMMENKRK